MAVGDLQAGSAGIRKEVIDSIVKQTAARTYKFKQACAIVPTSAWTNDFFREDLTVLAGQTGNSFRGVRPGAAFPQASINVERVSGEIIAFKAEENIPWETGRASQFDIQARTVIRLTEGIVKEVDDYIWEELTESRTMTGVIQSFAILNHRHWNVASAAIIDDVKKASQLISTNGNYDTTNLICFISPRDERSIMNYIADKGAQWMPAAQDAMRNGTIGQIAGVTFVTSQSVTASYALVVKPKTCATIQEFVPLTTNITDDPLKSWRLRVVEELQVQLTDPKAIVLIKDTQGSADNLS